MVAVTLVASRLEGNLRVELVAECSQLLDREQVLQPARGAGLVILNDWCNELQAKYGITH